MKKVLLGGLILLTAAAACIPTAPASADSVGGPHRFVGSIAPGETHRVRVTFFGNELAEASGIGDGDIDMRVVNDAGVVVAEDLLTDNIPVCQWTPPVFRTYTIELTNAELYTVDYVLETN
jgi:hypothetical protein